MEPLYVVNKKADMTSKVRTPPNRLGNDGTHSHRKVLDIWHQSVSLKQLKKVAHSMELEKCSKQLVLFCFFEQPSNNGANSNGRRFKLIISSGIKEHEWQWAQLE